MTEFFKGVAIGFLLGICLTVLVGATVSFDRFADAVIHVESKGKKNAIGDQGRSHGLAQISVKYYIDAAKQLKRHGIAPPPYAVAVKDYYWVKQLIRAYMEKFCPDALAKGDYETMARVHNAGPRGAKSPAKIIATNEYVRHIREALEPTP